MPSNPNGDSSQLATSMAELFVASRNFLVLHLVGVLALTLAPSLLSASLDRHFGVADSGHLVSIGLAALAGAGVMLGAMIPIFILLAAAHRCDKRRDISAGREPVSLWGQTFLALKIISLPTIALIAFGASKLLLAGAQSIPMLYMLIGGIVLAAVGVILTRPLFRILFRLTLKILSLAWSNRGSLMRVKVEVGEAGVSDHERRG